MASLDCQILHFEINSVAFNLSGIHSWVSFVFVLDKCWVIGESSCFTVNTFPLKLPCKIILNSWKNSFLWCMHSSWSAAALSVPEVGMRVFRRLQFCHKSWLLTKIVIWRWKETCIRHVIWWIWWLCQCSFQVNVSIFSRSQLLSICAVWMPCCCSSTVCSVQEYWIWESSVTENANYDCLSWLAQYYHLLLESTSLLVLSLLLTVRSLRLVLLSVSLSVVKRIWCPETDEGHHQNKVMDLGHSASS